MRTKSSLLNMFTAYLGQLSSVVILLISRYFFIQVLGREYLGLNGLFSNILTLLSLVELGVGPAIIYALYEPIAKEDHEKIKSLMKLYKKVYLVIGIVILLLGIALMPFLSFFISEPVDIPNLKLIFFLFVLSSSVTYFFSYKRSLISCDKYRYILPLYKYGIAIIANIIEIIILLLTKNYIIYLILQIIFIIIENLIISYKADQLYPYLKDKKIKALDKKTQKNIIKNTKAMVFHKLGSVLVRSTDNIIISKFISLTAVGYYSNYYLVTSAFDNVSNQLFNSITASAGNLYAVEDHSKSYIVFKRLFFINFIIYFIYASILLCVLNPFIEWWLGPKLLFTDKIVLVLVINIYLNGMRKGVLVFRDAMGLYYQDRYKPIFESLINIVVSIFLAQKIGIIGVFIGTTICILTTSFWVEPYILYKHGLKEKPINYFKTYIFYMIITILGCLISTYLCHFISNISIINLIIRVIISLLIPIISVIILFRNKEEYQYLINLFKSIKTIVSR